MSNSAINTQLKNRLKLIQSTRQKKETKRSQNESSINPDQWPLWEEIAHKTLRRDIYQEITYTGFLTDSVKGVKNKPERFPESLAIIIPDFLRTFTIKNEQLPKLEELLFFDLETTGLSGGAGTIAFLAAFGRFMEADTPAGKADANNNGGNYCLKITQYLLLDYPGECDFVEKVLEEFYAQKDLPVLVTYNGKSFDTQILYNRCLMNRLKIPEFHHADLLHPARRLWKNILPNCSQATIEEAVLGLDRTGDMPGSLAPEIWFSFLRNGENRDLLAISEHNEKDIYGLAKLFLAMCEIAADPVRAIDGIKYDEGDLAVYWDKTVRKYPFLFDKNTADMASSLLLRAAERGNIKALVNLAIDAEWRKRDFELALKLTITAIKLLNINNSTDEYMLNSLENRKERLEKKQGKMQG